jgi:glycosyltransferase involved in cell wall biosynthesis
LISARRRLHLHTLLERTGGAARVAFLLGQGLESSGWEVGRSCEFPEGGSVLGGVYVPGEEVIGHLHSTADWVSLLEDLPERGELVITMHDCSLLTGGCVYPMTCRAWIDACPGYCPRGYPGPGTRRRRVGNALRRLGPVLVAPSRWLGGMARTAYPDLRIAVVPNGIPWPLAVPRARELARKKLGIHQRACVVLFAAHGGRNALTKGGEGWERIWKRVKARVPQAVGIFVGGREGERRQDMLVMPALDRSMMDLVLDASDLLAYPTLADNHPLVVLEAMSKGVCVVAFGTGGIGEQIVDGLTGILTKPGDWDGLAELASDALLTGRAARIARTAQDLGRARFSVQRMVRDYERIYERLGGSEAAGAAAGIRRFSGGRGGSG